MIFLDVGAHEGQTLEEVVKSRWPFDRIVAFEPMPDQMQVLRRRFGADGRVELCPHGLSDRTGSVEFYGANEGCESSMWADKNDVDRGVMTVAEVVDVSAWFSMWIAAGETVVMKLNCEGAEVPILDSLLDSGQIAKVADVMIDWDCRKIPSLAAAEGRIMARFVEVGFDRFSLCDDVMVGGTHQERIANWLGRCRAVCRAV